METETDNTRSTILDSAASNRGQGQQGKWNPYADVMNFNCRLEHANQFYESNQFRRKWGYDVYAPDLYFCPRCGVNVRYNKNWATQDEYNDYEHYIDDMIAKQEEQIRTRYAKKHAGHFLGAREFTLTYSPKWFTDDEARAKMRLAIERLTSYHKTEIIELRAVGEVGKEGNSHIHCYYLLDGGKKIPEKHFKRAYPPWDSKVVLSRTGHKGGHHAEVKSEADFKSYIDKEVEDAWFQLHIDNREK